MTFLLIISLLFSDVQDTDFIGVYSYGDGFNFEYLTLTDIGEIERSSFSDMYGRRKRKTGTYMVHGDTLLTSIRQSFIIRRTDQFIALVPPDEIANWEIYLKAFEEETRELPGKLPDEYLPNAFSKHKIYVKPK